MVLSIGLNFPYNKNQLRFACCLIIGCVAWSALLFSRHIGKCHHTPFSSNCRRPMASGVFRAIPAAWFPGTMIPSARPDQLPREGQMNRNLLLLCLVVSLLAAGLVITVLDSYSQEPDQHSVSGSETTFSYQGYLSSGSSPVEGDYDFSFTLNDSLAAGLQVGPALVLDDVNVSGGQFSVQLDFGDVFDGTPFWLEIGVSSDKDSEPYTFLSPRHALGASPYAGLRLP
jgi:hypothetical protein